VQKKRREKNIWTQEGPSIENKKKYGHMKVQEREIAMSKIK
jgi:hypothetical protein